MKYLLAHTLLPAIAIALAAAGCAKQQEQQEQTQTPQRKAVAVKVEPPVQRSFEDRLFAQGSLKAKNYANVSVKIEGTLEQLPIDEGDRVVKDQTVLFVTDTRKPSQNRQVAEQQLLVATEQHRVAVASVDKAQAQRDKALKDRDRYENLFRKGNVTLNEKETYDTQFVVADANLKLAQAQAQAADAQRQQAQVSFNIAARDLDDCTIRAPLSGVVTKRHREPGEYASKSNPVLRIEDPALLEAAVLIPGRYFDAIVPGKTSVRLAAEGVDAGSFPVTYRADTIDTTLRTFEVKARVDNPDRRLAAGMMASVTLILNQRQGLGVPSHAIIERNIGKVIFVANGDKARLLAVKTGLTNDGVTEILAAETVAPNGARTPFALAPDTQVITEGQYLLIDDSPIAIRK